VAGSFLPAAWLGIVVHAYRARGVLGRWPTYNQPDPKDLPLWLVRDHDERVVAVVAAAVLVLLGAILLYRVTRPGMRVAGAVGLSTLGAVVGLGLMYFDPGGLFEWWAD